MKGLAFFRFFTPHMRAGLIFVLATRRVTELCYRFIVRKSKSGRFPRPRLTSFLSIFTPSRGLLELLLLRRPRHRSLAEGRQDAGATRLAYVKRFATGDHYSYESFS
jgi:hypothetical protein